MDTRTLLFCTQLGLTLYVYESNTHQGQHKNFESDPYDCDFDFFRTLKYEQLYSQKKPLAQNSQYVFLYVSMVAKEEKKKRK